MIFIIFASNFNERVIIFMYNNFKKQHYYEEKVYLLRMWIHI